MLRWLVVASLLGSACKVVNTTAGTDAAGSTGTPFVGFMQSSTRVAENEGVAHFFLNLSAPSDEVVTVSYTLSDGSAIEGVDYFMIAQSSPLTFAPGMTQVYGSINIANDSLEEPDEYFRVALVAAQGAQINATNEFTVTIASNFIPRVSFESASSMGFEGAAATVAVVLSQPSNQFINVNYSLSGTTSFNEYSATPQVVSFGPGSVRELITISKVNDIVDEPDETIVFTLGLPSGPVQLGTQTTHTHLNRDDDAGATVSFTQSSVTTYNEGNTTQVLAINVHATVTGTNPITVPFTLHPTTTADSSDFTIMTPSPLIFPSGANDQTIMVAINGDSTIEATEDIVLQLGMPTNATLGFPSQVTLRLMNDDCLGTGTFRVCPDGPMLGALTLPAQLDTDNSSYCSFGSTQRWQQAGHPPACIVLARTIHVDTTQLLGTRPLVLVATESITIAGVLDASARDFMNGSWFCVQGPQPGTYAGGAGGSFMTAGGDGGAHHNPGSPAGVAQPADAAPPSILRGGCQGQPGGGSTSSNYIAHGGGAVYLVAGTSITLQSGSILNASGNGAPSPEIFGIGGGGGGSGGMIMLDAPTIVATGAYVVANGGGGAEGATSTTTGARGGVPNPLMPFVAALGGTGGGAGDGGNGFAQGSPATRGSNGSSSDGAGGGGGGAGYIKTSQPLTGAFVSPAPL